MWYSFKMALDQNFQATAQADNLDSKHYPD